MSDVSGLPDVPGLDAFVAATQDKGPQTEPAPQPAPPAPAADKGDYDAQMLKKFENPKETLKHFKEIQSFASKMAAEKKAAEEALAAREAELARIREETDFGQPAPYPPYQQPQQPVQFYTEDERMALQAEIDRTITVREIRNTIEEEQEKHRDNPTAFWQKWGMVQQLAAQYPQKANSPKGVRDLFKRADEYIAKMTQDTALRAIESLPDDAIEKFRKRLSGEIPQQKVPFQSAFMPETTSATRTGSEPPKRDFNAEREAAIKRGDADAVIQDIFKEALGR